ncbi:SFT2 domain containing 2a [Sardina pilchardus]|uniref:SFT2 domain containing 2a n=1 Tax=Sardina pilchardus TaxID=27697 RepID=UPI002E145CAF
MDKLRAVLGGRDGQGDNRTIVEAANEASTLGWGTRVKGFIACMVVGVGCTVLGVCCLFIPKLGLILFIAFYSFGNVCSLASTMFLMGPMKQLKRMCDKTRFFATAVMITCLVLTLCAVFWWKIFILALLFVILQSIAFAWYGLSYIPFARDAILKFLSMMCRMCVKKVEGQ